MTLSFEIAPRADWRLASPREGPPLTKSRNERAGTGSLEAAADEVPGQVLALGFDPRPKPQVLPCLDLLSALAPRAVTARLGPSGRRCRTFSTRLLARPGLRLGTAEAYVREA